MIKGDLQMVICVVCGREIADGKVSLGFVTKLQESYALKKSHNSASLGVGAFGRCRCLSHQAVTRWSKSATQRFQATAVTTVFFDLVKRYLVLSEAPGLTTDLKRFRPLSRSERLGASGSRAWNRAAVCTPR